jgi:hypothetical protein
LFARTYKLTSVGTSDGAGHRWFIPAYQDRGYAGRDDYFAARELFDITRRGALRIDMSGESTDAT